MQEHLLPGQLGNALIAISFALSLISFIGYFLAFKSSGEQSESWKKFARRTFIGGALASFAFIGVMFYLLVQQYTEYTYIWEQTNAKMSMKYILVAFWGGQSGSFMLWIFWHQLLGLALLWWNKKWEIEVMGMFAMVSAILTSMLLGIYIGDYRLGTNPFALQRETEEGFGTIWSRIPDYLTLDPRFETGRGLNPLLQNYWMIIHPPTLFLGFALTLVPFAFAVGGIMRKQYSAWIKPALPWTFAGIMVLGTGILMGGAWAYESLSFGGFWAWDPVENASLVPWIFLVAAGHLMLVNKDKERSIYSTLLLTMLSFIFILYSTFLTRSGVLGETSVHSFTGDGLLGQLLAYQLFFVWMMIVLLLVGKQTRLKFTLFCSILVAIGFLVDIHAQLFVSGNFILTWKGLIILVFFTGAMIFMINNYLLQFPRQKKEEELWSREFWIFIASIVLSLSAIQITIDTSIPVINALFDSDMQLIEQTERNAHYNNWQTPFSIIILFLLALTQFLKYQNTDFKQWTKAILRPLLIAFGLTLISAILLPLTHPNYYILLFTCYFAISTNADYWLLILKGKKNHAGQAIAHIGFALVILGALISQNRQEIISATYDGEDIRGYSGDKEKNPMDNRIDAQIFRNDTSEMKDYFIAYRDKSLDEHFLRFHIDYFSKVPSVFKKGDKVRFMGELYEAKSDHESDTSRTLNSSLWQKIDSADLDTYYKSPNWSPFRVGEKVFELTPFVQLNDMTNVAEPGTKHFFDHDVFTHIKYADLRPINDAKEMPPFRMTGKLGATIAAPGFVVTLKELKGLPDTLNEKFGFEKTDIVGALGLRFFDRLDVQGKYPVDITHFFKVEENNVVSTFQDVPYFNVKINLDSIRPVQKEHLHDPNNPAHMAQHATEDSLAALGQTMSDTSKMEFNMAETELVISFKTPEFIVMHAIRFPWISILWIGSIVMVLGTALAIRHRIQLNRKSKTGA